MINRLSNRGRMDKSFQKLVSLSKHPGTVWCTGLIGIRSQGGLAELQANS